MVHGSIIEQGRPSSWLWEETKFSQTNSIKESIMPPLNFKGSIRETNMEGSPSKERGLDKEISSKIVNHPTQKGNERDQKEKITSKREESGIVTRLLGKINPPMASGLKLYNACSKLEY